MTKQKKPATLAPDQAHVYFYALPIGERFVHQGKRYVKAGDEAARQGGQRKTWTFEAHYGCVIDKSRAKALKLPRSAHRPLGGGA